MPCSRAESGPHSPRSTQIPPGNEGGRRVKRITTVECLLSADSLSVGSKVTLMLIVMLHIEAETEQL